MTSILLQVNGHWTVETFAVVVSKVACTSWVATWTTLTVDRDSDSDSYFSCSETKSWNGELQSSKGESYLPQDCIGSPESQSEAVSSYPCVDEAQPGTKQQIFLFCVPWQITLSPRSATETDLEDTLGGEDDATEGDGDDDIAELAVSVFSFLGDLVQVSPFDIADSRSSE